VAECCFSTPHIITADSEHVQSGDWIIKLPFLDTKENPAAEAARGGATCNSSEINLGGQLQYTRPTDSRILGDVVAKRG